MSSEDSSNVKILHDVSLTNEPLGLFNMLNIYAVTLRVYASNIEYTVSSCTKIKMDLEVIAKQYSLAHPLIREMKIVVL